MRYPIGTGLILSDDRTITGKVVGPDEIEPKLILPGDICVRWSTGQSSTYDEEWLEEFTEINV